MRVATIRKSGKKCDMIPNRGIPNNNSLKENYFSRTEQPFFSPRCHPRCCSEDTVFRYGLSAEHPNAFSGISLWSGQCGLAAATVGQFLIGIKTVRSEPPSSVTKVGSAIFCISQVHQKVFLNTEDRTVLSLGESTLGRAV